MQSENVLNNCPLEPPPPYSEAISQTSIDSQTSNLRRQHPSSNLINLIYDEQQPQQTIRSDQRIENNENSNQSSICCVITAAVCLQLFCRCC
jgi:hypothetical protein